MSSRVPACQISTFYYVGFAYMMMRRYQDAIRTFSNILLYIQRTKQMFQNKTYLYDQVTFSKISGKFLFIYWIAVGKKNKYLFPWQVNKQNEQMYTLLAMCLVLHPMRIDESIHSQLREKFGDRMLRMQKG